MKAVATELDQLVESFDKILSESGATTIRRTYKRFGVESSTQGKFRAIVESLEDSIKNKVVSSYEKLLEITAEIIATIDEEPYFSNIDFPPLPELGHDKRENIINFIEYVGNVRVLIQPFIDDEVGNELKNQFFSVIENKKRIMEKGFFYEFTDGDLKRIQQLINELRDEVSNSAMFDSGHKMRLLRRLEALQSEMHKRVGDLDRLWGLIGDAGVAIGKFGKESKPFVDRIKELSQITWRTQSRAEELPSGSENPLIEHDSQRD